MRKPRIYSQKRNDYSLLVLRFAVKLTVKSKW